MIPLPRDVVLKVERAEHHIRELDDRVNKFVDTDPMRFEPFPGPEHSDDEPAWRAWGVRAVAVQEVPGEIAVVVGDAVQNLRSTLDYLARALVESNGGTPVDRSGGRSTAFPLIKEPPRHELVVAGGVSQEALDIIRDLQPFASPSDPVTGALLRLYELANHDKHRALHMTVSGIAVPSAFALVNELADIPYGMVTPVVRWLKNGDWAVGPAFPLPLDVVAPEVRGSSVRALVSLPSDGPLAAPIAHDLDYLLRVVRDDVIPRFRGCFADPWPDDVFSNEPLVDPLRVLKSQIFDGITQTVQSLVESLRPPDGSEPRAIVVGLGEYFNVDPRLTTD